MKKALLILPLVTLFALTGCRRHHHDSYTEITGTDTVDIKQDEVRVDFYLDYNQVDAKNIYVSYVIKKGTHVKEPKKPTTPPMPEFPVFKGWSKKEIIDNYQDLWNFDRDVVDTLGNVFNLYGIWVCEGE